MLLIRLLQGVVSKGSWTAGYTMSKHRRPGARGFDRATESGSWEEWGGPTRVANVASAGGPCPAPRTHSQSPSLSRTVICSRSPLPGAGHPGDVRLAPSPPRHLFQIPSPGPTPPLSENPQPLHPDSPESAGLPIRGPGTRIMPTGHLMSSLVCVVWHLSWECEITRAELCPLRSRGSPSTQSSQVPGRHSEIFVR